MTVEKPTPMASLPRRRLPLIAVSLGLKELPTLKKRDLYLFFYLLCSRLFENIVSDPNHKLKALLPPDYDNSRYNLRRQRHFNMPKLCTNRTSNTFIYGMSKQFML